MFKTSDITIAILAGGLGKRLRSKVFDHPKVLAEVNNTPFLQKILDQLNLVGFKNVVLCTGYLGDQIEEKFGKVYKNLSLSYSKEEKLLGTGGALKLALPLLKSEIVLVMNGDSYCEIDFKKFLEFHLNKKANASLVAQYVSKADRFGKIYLGSNDEIISFKEKEKSSGGHINAGIYLINKSLISEISGKKKVSLEKEIFPAWLGKRFYGFKTDSNFIDIGTPQSYLQAEQFFNTKRFILLDRDGTLVVHHPYLSHPDQIELIPGAVEALKEFKKMGLGVVIITNQSGVGRGYFDLKMLKRIHQRLIDLLAKEGIFLADIYFCPHSPEDNCLCRKPKVELIERAAKKHYFDPKLSFVIGDNKSDIELGKNIGATTLLVRTGHGVEVEKEKKVNPDYIVDDLLEAADIIENQLTKKPNF